MRVVIDTNILISFAIRKNENFEIMFDLIADAGKTLISYETFHELFSVLNRDKFRKYISQSSVFEYVKWYSGISEYVDEITSVTGCRDPADDKFLSLAISGKADCIVAGDKDLLDMERFYEVPILTAPSFLKRYQ